jgi:hypothetical protein
MRLDRLEDQYADSQLCMMAANRGLPDEESVRSQRNVRESSSDNLEPALAQ